MVEIYEDSGLMSVQPFTSVQRGTHAARCQREKLANYFILFSLPFLPLILWQR